MTARSGDALCAELCGQNAVTQVEALAAFAPRTSAQAVGKSLAKGPAVVAELENALVYGVFRQFLSRGPWPARPSSSNRPGAPCARTSSTSSWRRGSAVWPRRGSASCPHLDRYRHLRSPAAGVRFVELRQVVLEDEARGKEAALAKLRALADAAGAAIKEADDEVHVSIRIVVSKPK